MFGWHLDISGGSFAFDNIPPFVKGGFCWGTEGPEKWSLERPDGALQILNAQEPLFHPLLDGALWQGFPGVKLVRDSVGWETHPSNTPAACDTDHPEVVGLHCNNTVAHKTEDVSVFCSLPVLKCGFIRPYWALKRLIHYPVYGSVLVVQFFFLCLKVMCTDSIREEADGTPLTWPSGNVGTAVYVLYVLYTLYIMCNNTWLTVISV